LYAQSLNVKERHTILPPMIATLIMQSVAFYYFAIISSYSAQFSLTLIDQNTFRSNFYCLIAPMTTYLKDLTRSIGRYGGHSKNEFGFGFLDAQVVSLLSAEFWLAKILSKHHMLKDL